MGLITASVVWIIDAQQWPRACLRAELIEQGIEALGFPELSQAIEALHQPGYQRPCVIVLELHGLLFKAEELKALAATGIPIVVLGGAGELSQEMVRGLRWAAMIQRPFTIGTVVETVMKLARSKI